MTYTQLKVKAEYRDKLKKLADKQHRSMANLLEVLIDMEVDRHEFMSGQGQGVSNAN